MWDQIKGVGEPRMNSSSQILLRKKGRKMIFKHKLLKYSCLCLFLFLMQDIYIYIYLAFFFSLFFLTKQLRNQHTFNLFSFFSLSFLLLFFHEVFCYLNMCIFLRGIFAIYMHIQGILLPKHTYVCFVRYFCCIHAYPRYLAT